MFLTTIWNGDYYELDIYQKEFDLDTLIPKNAHEIHIPLRVPIPPKIL